MSTTGVDAPPSTNVPQRGGFLGFLGTIPGILTAFAGVITALASLVYIASLTSSPTEVPPSPDSSVDVTELYTNCANGDMYSCDDLYVISPAGSNYEAFGATCGGRFEWQDGWCSEL